MKLRITMTAAALMVAANANADVYMCTQCEAGTYAPAGATRCMPCEAGTHSSIGATSCTQCTAGTYSPAGSGRCEQCAAGTYSGAGATACTPCPDNATGPAGASKIQSCSCRDGYTSQYDIQVTQESRDRCASLGGSVIGANCTTNHTAAGCYYLGGTTQTQGGKCDVPLHDSVVTLKKCDKVMCGAGQYLSGTTCSACPAGKYMSSTSHSSTSCYNTCKDVVIAFGDNSGTMSYEVFSPDGKQHACPVNYCMHPLNYRKPQETGKVGKGAQYSITCDPEDGTPYFNEFSFHPCGNVMIMYGPNEVSPNSLTEIVSSNVKSKGYNYYLLAFYGNTSNNINNKGAGKGSYTSKCGNDLFGDPHSGKAKSCFIPGDGRSVGYFGAAVPIAKENEEFEVVCDSVSRDFKIKTSSTYGSQTYTVRKNGLMLE